MWSERAARGLALIAALALAPLPAGAQRGEGAPLSAIEWLERQGRDAPRSGAPPVADSAGVPEVRGRPLREGPAADAVGLLPPRVTGFPPTLWSESRAGDLVRLVGAQRVSRQPAMQDLLYALLLAEALPPAARRAAAVASRARGLRSRCSSTVASPSTIALVPTSTSSPISVSSRTSA